MSKRKGRRPRHAATERQLWVCAAPELADALEALWDDRTLIGPLVGFGADAKGAKGAVPIKIPVIPTREGGSCLAIPSTIGHLSTRHGQSLVTGRKKPS